MSAVQPFAMRPLSAESCALELRAQPGASRSALVGTRNGRWKIALRSPARDGRANEELIEVLDAALGLKRRALTLLSGGASRLEQVSIPLSVEEAQRRLREHLTTS